ncbi:MFS transporter [Nocardia aurantia]|uniref:Putative multidrug resistance protein MdtD n=1 Tax=Nocardia aurantia TaxID=2585199 RepID=A0A7K0DSJ0_9NOCA|nr:MFS transporter [Nocardia aurantia]MQY28686.1 putative multidrug resistance protein MdtD [Nocardia aurantia]
MTNSTTREPASPAVPVTDASASLSHRQILTILSGLLLGIFLAALDQNIVSVAIVKIANSLHGFDEQAWATTAYLITATVSTPLYGKLADIYGRKPFYLVAIGLFVIGSAACTFAGSMYQLAGFRAFQGLGAGGLMSLAFTIIGDIVPARERVRYQGYFMMVFGSATVLGPVLGGLFSNYDRLWGLSGWRWVFLVNVPVGVLALVVVARVLNVPLPRQRHRVDWFGAVLLAVCVVPLLVVAEQGRGWGWTSHRALLCYGIAVAGLLCFLLVEFLMREAALIPLRLFRSSTFAVTILGGFIVGVAMFGAISMVPLYLQVVRGFSPTKSGLLMLPLVLGIMVGSQLAGQLTRTTGRYKIQPVLGTFVIAVGALLYAQVHYDSPLWQPLAYSLVIGFGLGGCMQTLITAAQNAGPRSDMGVSTATATFCRQMGGTLGVAVFLTIMFNLLPRRIVTAFGGQLPPGFDGAELGRLQSNTSGIAALPDAVRRPVLIGFTESLQGVFYAGAGVALAACLVLIFMKEIPLQDLPVHASEDVPVREESRADPAADRPEPATLAVEPVAARRADPALRSATSPVAVPDSPAGLDDGHPITGHIRRDDGHPVPAAVLTLIDPHGRQVARAVARSDGEYRIAAPDHGTHVLIVSALGHRPAAMSVTVGDRAQTLDVALPGAAEVSGVVRSAGRGEPLPGATVTLTDAHGEVIGTVVTGDDGRYVCHGVVPGHYTLVAVAPHLRPAAATLTVPDTGLLRHDLELASMAVLAGAAWAQGRMVPDAEVTVLDATGEPIAATRTDDLGHYLVPDLPEGDYTVVARGYPPVRSTVTVTGGEVTHDVWLGYETSV